MSLRDILSWKTCLSEIIISETRKRGWSLLASVIVASLDASEIYKLLGVSMMVIPRWCVIGDAQAANARVASVVTYFMRN